MKNNKENELDHYLDALKALEYILKQWGEYQHHWLLAIRKDIQLWETEHQSRQHLGHYGGMGSFNDIGGGYFFDNIKSIAYSLAKNPDESESIEESLGTLGLQLDGWHCPNCGYDEVFKRKIELYVTNHFVRSEVLAHFKNESLLDLAKKYHDYDFSELDEEKIRVAAIAEKSNIAVIKHDDWSEACSNCNKKLEIYHWILNESGDKFIAFTLDGSALPDDIRSAFK